MLSVMEDKKLSEYLKNYTTYFSSRTEDNIRIYNTINKLLKFNEKEPLLGKKVLDLGSGDKEFYNVCLDKGIEISEIDGSTGINFEKDMLPYKDESFDIVIFTAVIEHLYSANLVLSEIYRILKPKGIVIIITPNFSYAFKNFYNDPTHVHPYNPISLKKVLEMNKFKNNKVYPWLVNKSVNYWKIPFKFFIAAKLPFKNHTFQNIPIPKFLRGKSTAMISLSQK
ncbi:class I SAM-dependent methyltransferase [Candidatus Pelagibacter sp.]|jgi:SAM-dependent methyltransferase|nr:class I SAM-dependent methyltransferase [Candidatus Pelagibacter sp.]